MGSLHLPGHHIVVALGSGLLALGRPVARASQEPRAKSPLHPVLRHSRHGALGFALKDILSNFVSGLLLLTLRPFRLGDQIVIGDAKIVFKTQFTGQPARS